MLKQTTPERIVIDKCPSCSGLWLDRTEIKRVAHDHELEKLAQRVRQHAQASPFGCPRCNGPCMSTYIGEVEVDTCTRCHGVWLDAGELEEAKRQLSVERILSQGSPDFRTFLRSL